MATVKRSTSGATTTISNSLLFFFFIFPAIIFSTYFLSSSSSSQRFINRGSSISSSSTISNSSSSNSFWLSPSGLFAFGFYPLNSCDHQEGFIIGIWLVKSSRRILVWSINYRDELPYSTFTNATSLLLKKNGKFVIQTSTSDGLGTMIIEETPLFFNISSWVSYGLLHDNGNLVFYDWNSNIIWESFNYPTDTILSGQTLNPGQSLVNIGNNNRLTMMEDGNLVLFKEKRHEGNVPYEYVVDWESHTKKKTSPIELRLNSTGHLYLVDRNGYIMKRLDNDTKQQNDDEGMIAAAAGRAVLYRATLDSDGMFRLYKEIIRSSLGGCECECEKTVNSTIILWGTNRSSLTTESDIDVYAEVYAVVYTLVTVVLFVVVLILGRLGIAVIADCLDRLTSKFSNFISWINRY